jgi:hypothetical protein
MNTKVISRGDKVAVSHDLGVEIGVALSVIGERVTVLFTDGTISSWGVNGVSPLSSDPESCIYEIKALLECGLSQAFKMNKLLTQRHNESETV